MKIAYCGFDFFHSCLKGLLEDGHELVEFFSYPTDNEVNFNDKVLSYAKSANARVSFYPIGASDIQRLGTKNVDILICASYPYKVPEWQKHLPYAFNVHPALLPEGRGPWPQPISILKNLPESGITIHEISPGWDEGAILLQKSFPLSERETLESLSVRSQILAEFMVRDVVDNIEEYWKNRQPQMGQGSYWKYPADSERTISWDMPVKQIDRIVRAFSKFDSFLIMDGVRYFPRKIDYWEEKHSVPIGTLVHESNLEMVFAASDGFVCLSSFEKEESA